MSKEEKDVESNDMNIFVDYSYSMWSTASTHTVSFVANVMLPLRLISFMDSL